MKSLSGLNSAIFNAFLLYSLDADIGYTKISKT